MNILGISSGYHDSSACIVVNNHLMNLYYEDRFSFQKHDSSFPTQAVIECLKENNLELEDIDAVAYFEVPSSKSIRQLTTCLSVFPSNLDSFVGASKKIVSNLLIPYSISKQLSISEDKIFFIPHHLSHAAFAFITSGFSESAILTVDTVGEWVSTAIWKAGYSLSGKLEITPIELYSFPNSLGLFYSAITGYLGFKVNDGECSTMALAAFGKPIFEEQMKKILALKPDGTFQLDTSYFNFNSNNPVPVMKKFIKLFGPPRPPESKIKFSSFDFLKEDAETEHWANIAASAQKVFEEALIGLLKRTYEFYNSENICYSGGAALNCVANNKIMATMNFKNMYIPPDPGDGGSSAGAALYLSNVSKLNQLSHDALPAPFLGRKSMPELFEKTWKGIQANNGNTFKKNDSFEFVKIEDESYHHRIALEIASGKIIGLIQGCAEIGPRALGNRSIFARADSIFIAKKINQKIKHRAEFRPYACSILLEDAKEYFENFEESQPARWMQVSVKIKSQHYEKFKSVMHIDGTTRPQVCSPQHNKEIFHILSEYKKITGSGILLNTSLNEAGGPMAGTGIDGLLIFASTYLDILIVERNFLMRKNNE